VYDTNSARKARRPAFDDVPEGRRRNMAAIRGKDTKPEMTIRRLLHGMGYRYALHDSRLPGRPDIVFPGLKKAVEVRGCYFHRHTDPRCLLVGIPKTRPEFWMAKFADNVARDARNEVLLKELGWELHVVWECEVRCICDTLPTRLTAFLGPPVPR
jgi:DNA mismatch endonuclease Vsr